MTVIVTSSCPTNIMATSILSTRIVHDAAKVLFYYKGGRDLISLEADKTAFRVYIPVFSGVTGPDATTLVKDQTETIRAEMAKYSIGDGVSFLYDTGSKQILNADSFIDYVPYDIKRCIFIIEDPDGTVDTTIRHPLDISIFGQIQFTALILAKRMLAYPERKGTEWSLTGKKLLAFLISDNYYKPISFTSGYGLWDSLKIEFPVEEYSQPRPIDLSKMNVSRAKSLAITKAPKLLPDVTSEVKVINPPAVLEEDTYPEYKEELGRVRLSDILMMGLDSFFNGGYTDTIEVEIDIQPDIYKNMIVDPVSAVCLVELQIGASITLSQIQEDLQSDSIQLVM